MSETASLLNYVAGAVIVSATSAEPAWPTSYLQRADEPLLTWRSTSTAQQQIVLNLGAALKVAVIGLVNVNFTLAQIELASDVGITTGVGTRLLVPRACPSGRLQCGHLWPTTAIRQYMRLTIPTQATTDGASYFKVGGLWAGDVTDFPVGLGPDPTIDVHEPAADVRGVGNGAVSRLNVGEPYVSITCRRFGGVGREEGIDDEWGAWTDFDVATRRAGVVGVFLDYGNPAHFWPMRRMSAPRWAYTFPLANDTITLEEAIHP